MVSERFTLWTLPACARNWLSILCSHQQPVPFAPIFLLPALDGICLSSVSKLSGLQCRCVILMLAREVEDVLCIYWECLSCL